MWKLKVVDAFGSAPTLSQTLSMSGLRSSRYSSEGVCVSLRCSNFRNQLLMRSARSVAPAPVAPTNVECGPHPPNALHRDGDTPSALTAGEVLLDFIVKEWKGVYSVPQVDPPPLLIVPRLMFSIPLSACWETCVLPVGSASCRDMLNTIIRSSATAEAPLNECGKHVYNAAYSPPSTHSPPPRPTFFTES